MIEENILLAQYRQEILDQEQQIIDLEQKVEHMTAEKIIMLGAESDWFVRLDDKMFTQAEVDKKVDEERLRAWKENKAFQYDLAEQNAELRKQLGEKHDDNCRLQRQLAEENRKLLDALEVREDLEASTLSATVRMSNAEVMNDDLHAQLERLTSKVETLWERNLHIRLFRCMR